MSLEIKEPSYSTNILRLKNDIDRSCYKRISEYNLGRGLYLYLLAIAKYGPINMTSLAEALHRDNANATRSIKNLVKRGFVKTTRGSPDKRVFIVNITPNGLDVASSIMNLFDDYDDKVGKTLTPEENEELIRLLEKVSQGLNVRPFLKY